MIDNLSVSKTSTKKFSWNDGKSDEGGDDGDDEVVNYDDDDGDGNKRD